MYPVILRVGFFGTYILCGLDNKRYILIKCFFKEKMACLHASGRQSLLEPRNRKKLCLPHSSTTPPY